MPDTNPVYRNKRTNYYSDKSTDSMPIGSIIQVFKAKSNTFDNKFIPTDVPQEGITTAYVNKVGNANPGENPDYQYEGYLYCDGSEYNINDYPVLYSIIGNDYGGTPGTGVFESATITVNKENIFDIWPSNTLGTFKLPDLKAKKIVGNGPVWGSGSPTIGLNELTVGLDSIDGSWYLDKRSQKQQFSLGKITTTGYTDVSTTVAAYISGSQTVKVKTDLTRLSGPPDHTHLLLHSNTSNDDSRPQRGLFDSYLRNYQQRQGKLINFAPSGGLAFKHSHGLTRRAITDNTVATYDTYNYKGGDEGIGTLKSPGYYWASGGLSSGGTFEQVTYTPDPAFRTFNSTSVVGGVEIVTEGTPIYQNSGQEYTTAVTGATLTIPSDIEQIRIEVAGGSGSGAVGPSAGSSGGLTRVRLGDGSIFTITATGGTGGGASSTTPAANTGTGGLAGVNGSASITGTLTVSQYTFTTITTAENIQPTAGGAGPFWKGVYDQISDIASANKSKGGRNGVTTGSDGGTNFITNNASISFGPYTSNTTVVIGKSQPYYIFGSPSFELWGGNGASVGALGGCPSATGGSGAYVRFGLKTITEQGSGKQVYPTYTWIFQIGNTPSFDQRTPGGTGFSNGGIGGVGLGGARSGKDGGSGGGSTSASISVGGTTSLIAGAGGGGGMGGWDERGSVPRDCNGDGGDASGILDTTGILFGGDGLPGGSAGCVGGGGGGGGGGVGLDTGGAGNPGAGGGGSASHGGGIGGGAGQSAVRTDVATRTSFGASSLSSGRVLVSGTEDRSYWQSWGGGGGAGGWGLVRIPKANVPSVTNVTIDVGGGGNAPSGGTAGQSGYASVIFQKIIGYDGGSTDLSVGDIIQSASAGITTVSSSGSGVGNSGGFTLPTTQVPTVVIGPPDVGSGVQATATAVVSGGAVTSVTVNNGGSGYNNVPYVYFYGGAGGGTVATAQVTSGVITGITVVSSTAHTRYVKIAGTAIQRYVILKSFNTSKIAQIGLKIARGNNINGGDLPEDGGDELSVFYNTDGSDNFPATNYIDVIVPKPTAAQISSNYDGTSGNTRWYTYVLNLPPNAKKPNAKFKIVQDRSAANVSNDNGGDSDQYGIAEVIYYSDQVSELQFVTAPNQLSTGIEELEYKVEGEANKLYTAGMQASDLTFTLASTTPLIPYATIQPKEKIPLLEPYALVKYLIKAF